MIGPTKVTNPLVVFNSCYGCDFYKSKLVVSGRNPQYNYTCNHPDVQKDRLMIHEDGNIAYYSDEQPQTPSWCPVLNPKEYE